MTQVFSGLELGQGEEPEGKSELLLGLVAGGRGFNFHIQLFS